MAKADEATVASVINNITEKNANEDSKLSLKVMADFSEKNPEKLETLAQNNADQIEKLTISAVEEAESSQEDADLIAKVVAVASDESRPALTGVKVDIKENQFTLASADGFRLAVETGSCESSVEDDVSVIV